MARIRSRLSYANVISTLCLFLVLGGGAYAASKIPARSVGTKQLKNNAVNGTKVADGSLGAADITGPVASAANADQAANAAHAANADQLGGSGPGSFQSRVSGGCPDPKGIGSIDQSGQVTCNTAVLPISTNPASGTFGNAIQTGPLEILVDCHRDLGGSPDTTVYFFNIAPGGGAGTLAWFYGDGTSTFANSASLSAGGSAHPFGFTSKRIEGQFILSAGGQVWTVALHVVDAGSTCPVFGTASHT